MKPCCDSYHTQFSAFPDLLSYHEKVRADSRWERTEVKNLQVAALDKNSPLFADADLFDASVSEEAIQDTAENLKLAIKVGDKFFPLRDTAYKSLLDRAKISGSALPKLPREKLADVLNSCLTLHKDSALLLVREEKVCNEGSFCISSSVCKEEQSSEMQVQPPALSQDYRGGAERQLYDCNLQAL